MLHGFFPYAVSSLFQNSVMVSFVVFKLSEVKVGIYEDNGQVSDV
jgi:hypothetical protein